MNKQQILFTLTYDHRIQKVLSSDHHFQQKGYTILIKKEKSDGKNK